MEKTCYHLFSGYKNSKENKLNVVIYFRKLQVVSLNVKR